MSVSIAAWAERIGIQNRKIAALHKGRQEAYESIDAADADLAKIQAKYTDGGDGDSDADGKPKEPSAEDIKAMSELEAKIVAGRKAVIEADAKIAAEEAKKDEYKQEMEARERHNRTEERLNSSAGRSGDQGNYQSSAGSSSNIIVKPPTTEDLDRDVTILMRCMILAGNNPRQIPDIAREQFGNDRVAAAMQSNTFSAGGAFVPDMYLPRVIQGLFATAVVRSMGIPELPIEYGSLDMPRITTGATAGYVGEGQDADETSVGTDRVRLVPKQLIGLLPMSNTLIMQSSPGADQVFMDQLSIGVSLAEDRNMLRGPAAGAGPTGLRYLAASTNVFASAGSSVANIDSDAGKMENALLSNNVPMLRPFWIMAPRTFIYMSNLRDGNSNYIYPGLQLATPMFRGKPVKMTTNVPINLSGSNSEILLVDASQQLIGQNPRINLAASTEASYTNASGAQVNCFQRNETLLRMIIWDDINTMHPESIAVLTGVTY